MNRQSSMVKRQAPARGSTLWDPTPPARRGEDTQQAAALAVAPHTPRMRERVLAHIASRCQSPVLSPQFSVLSIGATNEEIALALGMRLASVCGRVHELAEAGQIRDSGLRRPGASGVGAKIWIRAEAANGREFPAARAVAKNIPGADA